MNTHILSQEFEYVEPRTIEEASLLISRYGEKARLIAGGTDLLVQMKTGKVNPEVLISISRIPALRYLIEEKGLRIGALTCFRDLERSAKIKRQYTALFEAARSVSCMQIKNMGTIGGNLCNGSPAADSAPPLIAFGGRAKWMEREQMKGLPLEDFFIGPGKTVLSPGAVLAEVEVPEMPEGCGSAFLKMGRVSADLAKVSVAAAVVREGKACSHCKIVFGAVGKTPLRTRQAEAILVGKEVREDILEKAAERASEEIEPIDDIRSTAWYRRQVSRVLARDAILLAWRRTTETGE